MYKEYIQILPSADAETAPPLVTCTETFSGLALPAPSLPAEDTRQPAAAPAARPDTLAVEAPATALPLDDGLLAAAARPRAPSDGRIALIAATLALALSTGALTWTLTRAVPAPPTDAGVAAALTVEIAGLKGRLAAADEQVRAGSARIQELAERLDRSEQAQGEAGASVARLAAQLASFEQGLDARVKAATEAAIAAAIPSPADITASIAARPGAEPVRQRPVQPAPAAAAAPPAPKPNIAQGWVLRDVAHGVALVENRRGFFEVAVGTPVPGLGRVEAIERREGRMVVVTSRGLILPPARQ
jgi:hypothetical protein